MRVKTIFLRHPMWTIHALWRAHTHLFTLLLLLYKTVSKNWDKCFALSTIPLYIKKSYKQKREWMRMFSSMRGSFTRDIQTLYVKYSENTSLLCLLVLTHCRHKKCKLSQVTRQFINIDSYWTYCVHDQQSHNIRQYIHMRVNT